MVGVLRPEDVRDPGGRGEPLAPEIIKELICNFFKPLCTSTHTHTEQNQNKHTTELESVACAAERLRDRTLLGTSTMGGCYAFPLPQQQVIRVLGH